VRNPARCGLRGMCASRCLWREYHSSETFSVTEAYGTVSIITTAFTSLNRANFYPFYHFYRLRNWPHQYSRTDTGRNFLIKSLRSLHR